ncbi:hypothetical protein DEIPH_ctg033orf0093 [Deinococcus phoenicis]|uniref:Copper resistance protein D domain-containing protein n=1 Tax=Deinococcus phoenicis TaxID=1476583 RepID=A0A016QNM5_9DEIO|nr:CopD family protein [Deinococcus phoenicis]EYB67673.1 hypothetical protein DEIPH_ctg033orf0093 [Deinococcus phoenicis]
MILVLAAAQALTFLGSLLLLGGTFARRALTPAHPAPRWLGLGGVLLALGAALEVGGTLAGLGFLTPTDTLAYLTDTGPGRAALTRVMGAALLLAAELSGWPVLFPVLASGVLLWGEAGGGHGGAHGLATRALTALHAGGMGVWLGGVLALLTHPAPTPALARRFTPVALGGVALLAGTGLLLTLAHAGNLLTLPGSAYGRTLLLKLACVALALLAAVVVRRAFAHSSNVRPHLALEALLLLAVLGVTAALVTTPPPTHVHPQARLSRP